jgi:hypothetical protein
MKLDGTLVFGTERKTLKYLREGDAQGEGQEGAGKPLLTNTFGVEGGEARQLYPKAVEI